MKAKKNHVAELNRRSAASMARATAGRASVVESKKVYDRKREKKIDVD